MDLMSLIKDQLNNTGVLKQLGQSVGTDSSQVSKLTQRGLPAILDAYKDGNFMDDIQGLLGKFLK